MIARPEELGGAGAAGGSAASSVYAEGMIRNLDIQPGNLATASVRFEFESDLPPEDFTFLLYQDGAAICVVRPGETAHSEPLTSGGHEFQIYFHRATESPDTGFIMQALGNRAAMGWTRATESDVVSYEVGWDEGDSGASVPVPFDPPVIVTDMSIVLLAGIDGGSGGRITTSGTWDADTRNGTLTLTIGADDAWELTQGADVLSTGTILPGAAQVLRGSLFVSWLDTADDYQDGDAWSFAVGPVNRYITDELPAGTYRFAVRAIDAHQNPADWSNWRTAILQPGPDAPADSAISWDPDTATVTLTWTDPDAAYVQCFTNFDSIRGTIGDYVLEEGCIGRVLCDGTQEFSFVLPEGVRGTILCYLRSEASDGTIEQNSNLLSVDAVDEPAATLASPVIVSAYAVAAGHVAADWSISLLQGTPAALNFYSSATGSWDDAELEETVAWVDGEYPTASGTWTSPSSIADPVYLAVRAVDGDSAQTPEGDWSGPITPDDTPPSAVTMEFAGPA